MVSKLETATAETLNDWMERTGTSAAELGRLMSKMGHPVSKTTLSLMLKGSRRVSLAKALALHAITGVSIESLTRWPKVSKWRIVRAGDEAEQPVSPRI